MKCNVCGTLMEEEIIPFHYYNREYPTKHYNCLSCHRLYASLDAPQEVIEAYNQFTNLLAREAGVKKEFCIIWDEKEAKQ